MASDLKVRSDFSEGIFTSLQFVSRENKSGILMFHSLENIDTFLPDHYFPYVFL